MAGEGEDGGSDGEWSRRKTEGMMSSFNPLLLPSPPFCFSSRAIFRPVQLCVCACVCVLMPLQANWRRFLLIPPNASSHTHRLADVTPSPVFLSQRSSLPSSRWHQK